MPLPDAPNHIKTNPCASSGNTFVSDEPQKIKNAGGRWLGRVLVSWDMEIETCVICISGKEGIKNKSRIGAYSSRVSKKFNVYGCIRWGFTVTQDKRGGFKISRRNLKEVMPTKSAWLEATTRETSYRRGG